MNKKHGTPEAFYQRLRNLSDIKNTSINENKNVLGTLIDFRRGTDKVAYGIIKENHHYFIKKSNNQKEPDVADFAYIGGLGNITEYQYKSLAEADKQRNMMLVVINEALSGKVVMVSTKSQAKQKLNESEDEKEEGKEHEEKEAKEDKGEAKEDKGEAKEDKGEDKKEKKGKKPTFEKGVKPDFGKKDDKEKVDEGAEEDIEKSAEAAAELDVAVEKEKEVEIPTEPVPDMGGEEVPAEPVPDIGGEEVPAEPAAPEGDLGGEEPAPDMGGEEDIDVDAVLGGGEEPAPEGGEEGDLGGEEGATEENIREIEKGIGKLTNKVRQTELTPSQTQSYLNSLLTAFEDKLPELEVEERKEMANKLLKIVPDEEIADIDISAEEEMAETKSCEECGFAKYVSERGHNAKSMGGCPNDEMANLMSGYMMDKGDEMGDEDYEDMAVFSNDDIEKSLYEEYGHMNVSDKIKPFTDKLNEDEANPEAKTKKIEGMFWWEIDPQKEKKTELVAEEVVDETLNGKDPAAIEVQPNLNEEENEEEPVVNVEVEPEKEEEPEVDVEVEPEVDDNVLDISKHEEPEMDMIQGFETMGAGIPKPDGAPTTTVDVNVDAENKTVNVTMNESEKKLRNYIRARLEEKAGIRKPILNEDKKSVKIKKLDKMIDEQIKLFESIMDEGGFIDTVAGGMEKAGQWIEGAFAKQKKIREMLPNLRTGTEVNKLWDEIFGSKISGGMTKFATRTSPDAKLAILKQASEDPNGLGKIKLKDNQFIYVPVNPTDTKGSSMFGFGQSRLGQ